jgi:WD40 repeat protein
LQRTLRDFTPVRALAWSPDSKLLATGGDDHIVRIWTAGTGQMQTQLESGGSPPSVNSLAWSPNGATLASGRGNHTLQLWDLRTGKAVHSLPTMAPVVQVGWTPGGSTVVASTQERSVRFWDAATGQLRGVLLQEKEQVPAVSADGHYRGEPGIEAELVYVVQTEKSQETLTPAEFASRFKWRNNGTGVRLAGN